ncbi:hypothetical protein L204_100237 [Cryptococcus depauperatus]|nr:hypothetical protein L204_02284 [Cryptococcus depauperatus CBS 7855]
MYRTLVFASTVLYGALAAAVDKTTSISSRWGHASTYIPSPPTLIIHGGKTDPTSLYTYSSAPNTASTIIIPLNSAFTTSAPPFTELDSPAGPTEAWHTISPVSRSDTTWQFLSFGGDGGTEQATSTAKDSAWIITLGAKYSSSMSFAHQVANWAGQPMNRVHHSAATGADGKVYLTGGLKNDGSGITFSDTYLFDPAGPSFSTLPSLPSGIYHHSSILLSNGSLLVFGGAFTSQATSNVDVRPFTSIYRLDTAAASPSWMEVGISGSAPEGRRGASAALNKDGTKVVLFGGASANLGNVYDDTWTLDVQSSTWEKTSTSGTGAGARYDFSAVAVGNDQIIIYGGYSSSGPADTKLYIFNSATNAWAADFTVAKTDSSVSQESESGVSGTNTATIGNNNGDQSGTNAVVPSSSKTSLGSLPLSVSQNVDGESQTYTHALPTSNTSHAASDAGANTHPLSTSIIVALVVGSVSVASLALGICLWAIRLRSRRQRQNAWPASGPHGRGLFAAPRPYGAREKGGPGLMEDLEEKGYQPRCIMRDRPPAQQTGWNAAWNAGTSAIGAGISSISSRIKAGHWTSDPYAELQYPSSDDGADSVASPSRRSIRPAGNGIRLLGPRPIRGKSLYYTPHKPVPAASAVKDARIDMFEDEDSRRFNNLSPSKSWSDLPSEEEDMGVLRTPSGRWRSTQPTMSDSDDGETDLNVPILAPFKGGPVPTPHDSIVEINRSHLDSTQYQLPSSSSEPLDLFGLLEPSLQVESQNAAMPSQRSLRSGVSGSSHQPSDSEEAFVQDVRLARRDDASLVSPVSPTQLPRNDSFFTRMTSTRVSAILRRGNSRSSTARPRSGSQLEIRDPAPQPTLWPIASQDQLHQLPLPETTQKTSSVLPDSTRVPPISWRGDIIVQPKPTYTNGPSLSSLDSARSMRNMMILKREDTESSLETTGVIEEMAPFEAEQSFAEQDLMPEDEDESLEGDLITREVNASLVNEEEVSEMYLDDQEDKDRREDEVDNFLDVGFETFGDLDLSLTGTLLSVGGGRCTSVSKATTLPPVPEFREETATATPLSKSVQSLRHVEVSPADARSDSVTSTPSPLTKNLKHVPPHKPATIPPKSKPLPSPYSKRRPVRDVVNSINKRGTKTPISLLAPRNVYASPVSERLPALKDTDPGHITSPVHRNSIIDPFVDQPLICPSQRETSPIPAPEGNRATSASYKSNRLFGPPASGRKDSGLAPKTTTMWEVIKKEEKLKVANPDEKRWLSERLDTDA